MSYQHTDLADLAVDPRKALNFSLKTWLLEMDKGGMQRTKLFRITTLELVTGDKGGNLRRWLAPKGSFATGYLPTLKTLEALAEYLKEYGFEYLPRLAQH